MENTLINVCVESDKIDIYVKYIKMEDIFFSLLFKDEAVYPRNIKIWMSLSKNVKLGFLLFPMC